MPSQNLLTTNDVAAILRVNTDRVRIYARRKKDRLGSIILGRVRRYTQASVDAFIKNHTV